MNEHTTPDPEIPVIYTTTAKIVITSDTQTTYLQQEVIL